MNDIQLIQTGEGKFDWNFENNDICNVIGDQQLISACVHNIYLKENELEQEIYQDKGSLLREYLKEGFTDNTTKKIIDEIQKQCKKIEGIYDAEVKISNKKNNFIIDKIILTKDNGGLVEIAIQKRNTDIAGND